LASIIEKRKSLHKQIEVHQREKEQMQFQFGQLQALANIGISTSMIAHEINNLLTPISNYAELALKHPEDKPLTEKALQKAARNCARASKVMSSILAMTNKKEEKKSEVKLLALVEEIFSCLCRDFGKDGITVRIDIPPDLTIWAVDVQIQQAIMNLILNAREAMLPKGGVLTIRSEQKETGVEIEVSDTGSGIARENLSRIFEPFFTTKADSKNHSITTGSGLGLAFCKKVIELHNGSVSVESQPSKGSTFRILLPASQQG
jgi:two-component system, NtrC family, sensor kinase